MTMQGLFELKPVSDTVQADHESLAKLLPCGQQIKYPFGDNTLPATVVVLADLDLQHQHFVFANDVSILFKDFVKDRNLQRGATVVQHDHRHLAAPGHLRAQRSNDAGNPNGLGRWRHVGQRPLRKAPHFRRKIAEQMT